MAKRYRAKEEVEAALAELRARYDFYCGVTSRTARAQAEKEDLEKKIEGEGPALRAYLRQDAIHTAEYRSKIKALYWILGESEL